MEREKVCESRTCGDSGEASVGAGCARGGASSSCGVVEADDGPLARFQKMIPNCLAYAKEAASAGRPVVGMMCEYSPRELIMAAGAVPVCLCGGSAATIAAAERDLPTNLCPLIKSTYGYHVQRSNPFLEMADLIVGETTCDGKKKMYELMAESRPMYVLELPHRLDDPDALLYWTNELRRFKAHLEARFGVEITDAKIRDAIRVMNTERRLRRELAALMKADDPALTGRQLLDLKSSISGIEADFAEYRRALATFSGESGGRAERPVRVLLTGVPTVHGAERVVEIVEDCGGLVVCMESCTGVKPILDDVDEAAADPVAALAEKYFRLPCSVRTPNDARDASLEALAAEYRPDCVIELVWQACLTYDVESNRIERLVENRLGIPYLKIETDYSTSDSARIALRVEALFEAVAERKSS